MLKRRGEGGEGGRSSREERPAATEEGRERREFYEVKIFRNFCGNQHSIAGRIIAFLEK